MKAAKFMACFILKLTSTLGKKITVLCSADILHSVQGQRYSSQGILLCLEFSMAPCGYGSNKELVETSGCNLGNDSCIPWFSSQGTI